MPGKRTEIPPYKGGTQRSPLAKARRARLPGEGWSGAKTRRRGLGMLRSLDLLMLLTMGVLLATPHGRPWRSPSQERASPRAQDASLKAVMDAIGQRTQVTVITRLQGTETLTLAFDRLTLEETLKRLHAHATLANAKDATHADDAIPAIWVLSSAANVTRPVATPPREPKPPHRPEPFQFDIHPSQVQSQSQREGGGDDQGNAVRIWSQGRVYHGRRPVHGTRLIDCLLSRRGCDQSGQCR